MVLVGNNRFVFTYNLAANAKSAEFDAGGRSFDSVYISASNKVTITWNVSGTARYQGIELFDSNMNFLRQVARAGGHMDMTRDANGDDVLVWTNAADPNPIANCPNGIVKIRLSDAQQTCILALGWGMAVHISAPDNAGWVMVETYASSDPMPGGSAWTKYMGEFLQVKLDGSETRRLAHHRSRASGSYTWQPKVSVSRDGAKLVFASNYGLVQQLGYPASYTDAYMIDVATASLDSTPSGSDAGSTASNPQPAAPPAAAVSTITRSEQTDSAIAYTGAWFDNSLNVHSGGAARLSMESGARAIFSFNGTGASWISYRDQWSGFAKVYVDGVLKQEIDTYASPAAAQYKMYSIAGLNDGAHTLTIEVEGRKNISSAEFGCGSTHSKGSWMDRPPPGERNGCFGVSFNACFSTGRNVASDRAI